MAEDDSNNNEDGNNNKKEPRQKKITSQRDDDTKVWWRCTRGPKEEAKEDVRVDKGERPHQIDPRHQEMQSTSRGWQTTVGLTDDGAKEGSKP